MSGKGTFSGRRTGRIASIDWFRVWAILAVIVVHTDPLDSDVFGGGITGAFESIISQSARVSVAYFFIIAGFFFGRKILDGSPPLPLFARYARRLLRIWLLWSAIYIAAMLIVPNYANLGYGGAMLAKFSHIAANPLEWALQGGKPHLWFLMSLVQALLIAAVCARLRLKHGLLIAGIILYVFGLLMGPYALTPVGIDIDFNSRNGPFMSTLLVAVGWELARRDWQVSTAAATGVAVIGWTGYLAEMHLIPIFFGGLKIADYGIFTPVYALGLVLVAFSRPSLGEGTTWSRLGARYVLGIYVCHYLFVEPMWPLHAYLHNYLWEFTFPLIVLGLSIGLVYLLFQSRYTRYLVQ
jgi:surface polysaccharide O-acyltransferase-like enzyme